MSLLFKCLVEPISALGILTVVNVKRLEIYRFGDALVLCHSSVESKERRSVRLQIYATSHVPATSFPFGIGAWLRLSIPKVSISTSLRVLAGVHIVTRDAKAKAVFRFSLSLVILSSGYGIDMASAKSTPSNLCYQKKKRDQKKFLMLLCGTSKHMKTVNPEDIKHAGKVLCTKTSLSSTKPRGYPTLLRRSPFSSLSAHQPVV